MGASIIDGKAIAADTRVRVGAAAAEVEARAGRKPGLRVLLVGEHPASMSYVKSKEKAAAGCNMVSEVEYLPSTITQAALLSRIEQLNADPAIDGILVQLPLPDTIDALAVLAAIDPGKDVDGFHESNVGGLSVGRRGAIAPCTPYGCLVLLRRTLGDLAGRTAFVLGRSNIVGKPMAQLLLADNCTVIIGHSRTVEPQKLSRQASILIAAVGRPGLVTADWVGPGATIIDVGINRVPKQGGGTRLVGDVAFDEIARVAGHITPVPGGVGPMTIAILLRNTVASAAARLGLTLAAPLD